MQTQLLSAAAAKCNLYSKLTANFASAPALERAHHKAALQAPGDDAAGQRGGKRQGAAAQPEAADGAQGARLCAGFRREGRENGERGLKQPSDVLC